MLYRTPRAVTRWPLCEEIGGDVQWVRERRTVLGSIELRKTFYERRACQPVPVLRNVLPTCKIHAFGHPRRLENGNVDIRGQVTFVHVGDEAGIPR